MVSLFQGIISMSFPALININTQLIQIKDCMVSLVKENILLETLLYKAQSMKMKA